MLFRSVQASQCPSIKAVVTLPSSGVPSQAFITHNWGLDASAPGYFDPQAEFYQLVDYSFCPSLTFDFSNTNVVAVHKAPNIMPTTVPVMVLVTLRRGNGPYG